MNNLFRFIILIILFTSCKNKSDLTLSKSVIQELKGVDVIMDFKNLTDIDWNQVIIISPKMKLKSIEDKYQINLDTISKLRPITDDESTYVVFLKNKKPFKSYKIPLKEGRFNFNDTLVSKKNLSIGVDKSGMFVLY